MNLEDIQPWIEGLINAIPEFQAAGVTAVPDDGTYPETPGREAALNGKGLSLVVWEVLSNGLVDQATNGCVLHDVYVCVVIEENAAVCRGEGGAGIPGVKALRLVLSALAGKMPNGSKRETLVPMDPPFENHGKENGVSRFYVNYRLRTAITPD